MNSELASVRGADDDAAGQVEVPDEISEAIEHVIAQRVREFRQRRGWTVSELAGRCGMSKGMLSKIENAQSSPSLATLGRLSEVLSVPLTAFFRGLDKEEDVLYIKAGKGLDIHHTGSSAGHRYQQLGRMRSPHDRLEPLLVTLTERAEASHDYQHAGTELIFMLAGKMEYRYGAARFVMEPGDALQFVGEIAHGPGELIQLPVQFLSVKDVAPVV